MSHVVAEKFLSRNQVLGDKQPLKHAHAARESQLAAARRDWQLVGAPQSRLEAWTEYAKLVADKVTESSGCTTAPLSEYVPSFGRSAPAC